MISELVKKAACPVIADMESNDSEFIDSAARRGIFAYVRHGNQTELAHTLDIVLRRYAEFSRIHGALGRRVIIEQAKGILMERRSVSADDAFALLRDHARNTTCRVQCGEGVVSAMRCSTPPPQPRDTRVSRRGAGQGERLRRVAPRASWRATLWSTIAR